MITIISKRRFGFRNPNPDKDILRTGLGPNAPKFHEAYFVTAGTGELEQAPEWINRKLGPDKAHPLGVDLNIQNILTWERAKKDGHILEVEVKTGYAEAPITDLEQLSQVRQAETAARIASGEGDGTRNVVSAEQLERMTKQQLVDHAAEYHDLELDPKKPREELLTAVKTAQQQKAGLVA